MIVRKCLRCGFCCTKAPCGFGKPLGDSSQCAFLSFDENNIASCDIHDEIIKDPSSIVSPAFGQGSCMPMNSHRDTIKERDYGGKEQFIEIKSIF